MGLIFDFAFYILPHTIEYIYCFVISISAIVEVTLRYGSYKIAFKSIYQKYQKFLTVENVAHIFLSEEFYIAFFGGGMFEL